MKGTRVRELVDYLNIMRKLKYKILNLLLPHTALPVDVLNTISFPDYCSTYLTLPSYIYCHAFTRIYTIGLVFNIKTFLIRNAF